MHPTLFTSSLLSLVLMAGCAVATGKGEEENELLDDGKLDSFYQPTHQGALRPGESSEAYLSHVERFHAWTFRLHAAARVSISVSGVEDERVEDEGGEDLDTVLYLYRRQADGRWGRYIGKNDDSPDDAPWSQLDMELEAAEYRIIVKGFKSTYEGPFRVTLGCEGEGCGAMVATRLWVPLLDENDLSPLALQNERIMAAGFEPLPVSVPISGDETGYDAWSVWVDRVEEIAEALELDGALLSYVSPRDYQYAGDGANDPIRLCYEGDAAKVPEALEALTDNVFSDQFALWAWKHAGEEGYSDYEDEEQIRAWMPTEFHDFIPSDGEVMVVSTVGDSGDDFTSSVIPRCAGGASSR